MDIDSLLFYVEDSDLLQNQTEILKQCGGIRRVLSAAFSPKTLSLSHSVSNSLMKYKKNEYHQHISPFINDITTDLMKMVKQNEWMRCDTSKVNDVASIIYSYGCREFMDIAILSNIPGHGLGFGMKTDSEIDVDFSYSAKYSDHQCQTIRKVQGIQDGMTVFTEASDDWYFGKFCDINQVECLKEINHYLSFSGPASFEGKSSIHLNNPGVSDVLYMIIDIEKSFNKYFDIPSYPGDVDEKEMTEKGWIKKGKIRWNMAFRNPACGLESSGTGEIGEAEVWEYKLENQCRSVLNA